MPTEDELLTQLKTLNAELDNRVRRHEKVEPYFEVVEGRSPVPAVVRQARVTNSYRHLMGMSETPWGRVIVNSKLDRLEVTGISSEEESTDKAVWGWWQDEAMDLESKLAHSSGLLDGRVHALVWPRASGPRRGEPRVTLDDATQMVVRYEEGSRRDRAAALRRWVDGERVYCTLYLPDGIYKFQRQKDATEWKRREVAGETWPLRNPLGIVPVVELAVNRRLAPGTFGYARGEFEDVTGLMDRINVLTFLGLVVAVWMGFPLRGLIGAKIFYDDDGNQLPPFENRPDSVFQDENPEAKLVEFKAADRGNLSVFAELTELAAATSTPRHYLPMEGGISNVSEPTIRAFEGGMHATINASHKPSLGEGWEEVMRLGGLMLEQPVSLSPRAATRWADHESRSLGERADAALKLSQAGLPWQGVAEKALNFSQDEIARYEAQVAGSAFGDLLREAKAPAGAPVVAPVAAMVPSRLVDAHLTAQERLRALAVRGVTTVWRRLPGIDEEHVPPFLAMVVPLVAAAQRQSILLTDAYLARALSRAPLGVDADAVIASLRGDTTPDEVYRRPFVTVWTALSKGTPFEQAVAAGLARATATAAMDVQLAHRGALQAAQDRDPRIRGYRRVADAGACAFCSAVDGAFVKSADAMPLHNGCGCGLEPVEDELDTSPLPEGVAVREHGELGPILGDPSHAFTSQDDL